MSSSDATTSVPSATLTDAGFSAPAETDILAGVQADITAALGGNVNQALTTPQGQLAMSETAIIGDCLDQILAVFNGIDPRTASGRMQDAIGYISFLTRETDEGQAAFEYRRENSVAQYSVGANASILGAILNVANVTDAYVTDNPNGTSLLTGGVTLDPHTLYVCYTGTDVDPAAIALAIIQRKSPGCGYTGSNSITVQDPAAVYNGDGPSYTVKYDIATDTPIYFNVQIVNSTAVPSTALGQIQDAIVAAFTNGTATQPRQGSTVLAARYYCAVGSIASWVELESITIGTTSAAGEQRIDLNVNQAPTITAANITLTLV